MKLLVAVIALSLSACVIRFPDDARQPPGHTILVCVFASCRDVCKKQETPTPPSSSRKGESSPAIKPRGTTPGARTEGIGPNKVDTHASQIRSDAR